MRLASCNYQDGQHCLVLVIKDNLHQLFLSFLSWWIFYERWRYYWPNKFCDLKSNSEKFGESSSLAIQEKNGSLFAPQKKGSLEIRRQLWQKAKSKEHKTVLMRERKRHTDRRLSSTPCAALSRGEGYPLLGGTPHPDLARGYHGQAPPGWDTPVHLDLARVPSPPRCGQTENITLPHPSEAVGKKGQIKKWLYPESKELLV